MANITRENIGLLNEKIVVTVEKDDYLPSFEKAMKSYSKQANIPGFRKGMVPVGMVKKMYGSSVFADEVIKSVEKGLTEYMETEKLEIFAQPLPLPENDPSKLDMNQPSAYVFAFEVGLKPEFSIADLGQAAIKRYKVMVTDEMIEEEMNHLQLSHGKMTDPETVSSEENVLGITFIETDPGGIEVEGGIRKDNSLLVKYFAAPFREQLMGRKKDDEMVIRLSQAFTGDQLESVIKDLGITDDAAAGDRFFKLVITKVGLIEKSELNEDFFKQAFPGKEITTEEEFRNTIREQIQASWDSQSRNQMLDQVYHILLDQTTIEFPQDFLKRWMLTSAEKPKTPEEVEQEYPNFVNQLKWTLIVDKIVLENDLEVVPEDIREFAKQQLLGYMGGSNIDINQPWINDYIDKMMKDKKYVEDSFHRIRTEKVFAWAESRVNPVETEITADEFAKLQAEHKHEH